MPNIGITVKKMKNTGISEEKTVKYLKKCSQKKLDIEIFKNNIGILVEKKQIFSFTFDGASTNKLFMSLSRQFPIDPSDLRFELYSHSRL